MSWLASWPNDEQKKNFSRNLVRLVDLAIDYLELQLAPQRRNVTSLAQFQVSLTELEDALREIQTMSGYANPTTGPHDQARAILERLYSVAYREAQLTLDVEIE